MSALVVYRQLARRVRVFPQYRQDSLWARPLHGAHGKPEAEADEQVKEKEAAIPGLYRFPKKDTNPYSVGSTHRLSCSKNKPLDLAVNKASEDRTPPQSLDRRGAQSPKGKPQKRADSRGFQLCRPEYASITIGHRRGTTAFKDLAVLLLGKMEVAAREGHLKTEDVVEVFKKLSGMCSWQQLTTGNTCFNVLLSYLVENLQQFSHPQLLQVLESLVLMSMPATHHVLGLVEQELVDRASQMSLRQLLLAADLWLCLGKQTPQFMKQLYDIVDQDIGVAEFVQLLYVIGEARHCPKNLVHPIQQLLMHHVDTFKPAEVGTVCLGLFKSQTSISQRSVSCLVDKASIVAKEMSDFAIVCVFKLLRFSYMNHTTWMEVMGQEVPRRAPGMGVMGLMHVVLACSALHSYNDSIIMSVAENVPSAMQSYRCKDICKLLWSFGNLRVLPSQCPELYCHLIEAMRRKKAEYRLFPEHLLTGLLGLAFVAQFPEDLLALALSPHSISRMLKNSKFDLRKDLCTLDGTVGLELPDWTGPRLDVGIMKAVAEELWLCAQSDICQKPEVLEAEKMLQELLGGKDFVSKRMILPHTRSIDLEIHLDSTGNPVPVNKALESAVIPQKNFASKMWPALGGVRPTDDLLTQLGVSPKAVEPSKLSSHQSWPRVSTRTPVEVTKTPVKLAVQVYSRSQRCFQSGHLMGFSALKKRQLELTGYRVVELNASEWLPLLRQRHSEKLAYLHCKVYADMD